MRCFTKLVVAGALVTIMSLPAGAQTLGGSGPEAHLQFRFFYRSPDLAKVPGLVAALERGPPGDWTVHPPITGFMAGILRRWKGDPQLLPPNPSRVLRADRAHAYSLAGQPAKGATLAREIGLSEAEVRVIATARPLLSKTIRNATELDHHWGAAFATGDLSYVRAIVKRLMELTQDEQVAGDALLLALNRREPGRYPAAGLKERYDARSIMDVALAAAMLAGVARSYSEHDFVRKVVTAELRGPALRMFVAYLGGGSRPPDAPVRRVAARAG